MNKQDFLKIPIIAEGDNIYNITVTINSGKKENSTFSAIKHYWNKFPKTLLLILLLEVTAIYGLLFFIDANTAASETTNKQNVNQTINAEQILVLTNEIRKNYNLPELTFNKKLETAAKNKAQYILNNNYFSHTGIEGQTFSSWIKEADYKYSRVGENLAINYNKAEDIIKAWLESPSHRKNILNPLYKDIGVALIPGTYKNKPTIIVVQLFGTPE